MSGVEEGQGAANLAGLWREQEGYTEDGHFLVLSGGDNWTGPAVSTWFDGQSMVEVMNAMGYNASAIGNHEFDFGIDIMQQRFSEAGYPYLGANIRYKSDGSVPTDLGIQPYALIEVADLTVGLIGLSSLLTPITTHPNNVADFDFVDYELTLREYVPIVRDEGADLVLVISHACVSELVDLAKVVKDLHIPMMGAGHCHELYAEQVGETLLLSGGSYLSSYASATFQYDPGSDTVVDLQYGTHENTGGEADGSVAAIVSRWQDAAEAELSLQVGYLEKEISRRSRMLEDLITETWLLAYPADIAITNNGGIRDGLPAGWITLSDIINVLPFNNTLVDVNLTGAQVLQVLTVESGLPAIGGIRPKGAGWVFKDTGEPLDRETTYSVLVNDFMYAGGSGYDILAQFDPHGYDTAIDWRQPVIDWIIDQESSPQNPLDPAIQALGK
jgi:2',3'-cyclic-nucleotide 2'-phosphodiesterase (5'-nucleotidase family)